MTLTSKLIDKSVRSGWTLEVIDNKDPLFACTGTFLKATKSHTLSLMYSIFIDTTNISRENFPWTDGSLTLEKPEQEVN